MAAPRAAPAAIGVVAALAEELRPLLARLAGGGGARHGGVLIRRGRLRGREVAVAATGVGARSAAAGLAALLDAVPVEAVLALGVAGGLSPSLAAGDLVWAARVVDGEDPGCAIEAPPWPSAEAALADTARAATVASAARILSTSEAKSELWRRLGEPEAAVVDLESACWARLAAERRLPWLVLRAVSDEAGEDLPLDFDRFRGRGGRLRRLAVARHALAHPQVVPELARLRARVRECARRLAKAAEAVVAA